MEELGLLYLQISYFYMIHKNSKNKTRKVYYSVKKAGSTNGRLGKKKKNKTKKVTFNPIFTLE